LAVLSMRMSRFSKVMSIQTELLKITFTRLLPFLDVVDDYLV
jgi:hypothetical protein